MAKFRKQDKENPVAMPSAANKDVSSSCFSEIVIQQQQECVFSRNLGQVLQESGRNQVNIPTPAGDLGQDQLTFKPTKLNPGCLAVSADTFYKQKLQE